MRPRRITEEKRILPGEESLTLTANLVSKRTLAIAGMSIAVLGVVLCLPAWPQDLSYHHFADRRTLLGIPNMLDVMSNLPFLLVGILGLYLVLSLRLRAPTVPDGSCFLDESERWPFVILFLGVFLTGLGSAYYHWEPNNDRLVWDRLPLAVAFMAFFASTIGERIQVQAGTWLLPPVVLLGAGSVVNWAHTDDLRIYAVVQYYPLLIIPVMLWFFPPRYTGTGYSWGALGWYVLAKIFELHAVDYGIFSLGQLVSGHTLKHLAAAVGAFWIFLHLRCRRLMEAE